MKRSPKTRRKLALDDAIPSNWLDLLRPGSRVALGLDLGTTEKKKSNPSALAVVEEVISEYFVRLLVRWKTSRDDVTEAVIRHVLRQLSEVRRRAHRLCIDATNERFFALNLRRQLAGQVPVDLVISSEAITISGEKMSYKAYLGNLYINTLDDGRLILPDVDWVKRDARQVMRVRGSFEANVDEAGNHADAFDAVKLALHGIITRGGPAEAHAVQVGDLAGPRPERPGIKNPFLIKRRSGRLLA